MPKVKDPINFDPEKAVSARSKRYESQREAAEEGGLDVNVVRRAEDSSNLTLRTAVAYARLVGKTLSELVVDSQRERAELLQPRHDIGEILVDKYHSEQLHDFPRRTLLVYADQLSDDAFEVLAKSMNSGSDFLSLRLAQPDEDQEFDTGEEFDAVHEIWSSHADTLAPEPQALWWPDTNLKPQPELQEKIEELVSKVDEFRFAKDPKLDGSFTSMLAALEHRSKTFHGIADLRKRFGVYVYGALLRVHPRREMTLKVASSDGDYEELLAVSWRCGIKVPIFFFSNADFDSVPILYTTIDIAADQQGLPF